MDKIQRYFKILLCNFVTCVTLKLQIYFRFLVSPDILSILCDVSKFLASYHRTRAICSLNEQMILDDVIPDVSINIFCLSVVSFSHGAFLPNC